jgi:peptide/nickel transport system substrate-binding protein
MGWPLTRRRTRKPSRLKLLRALVVIPLVLVIACTTTTAPGASASSKPQPDKLTIALPSEPDDLDLPQNANVPVRAWVAPNVAEALVLRNDDTGELQPLLATEWKWVDAATLRIKLRSGVKFHDGTTLEAKDVVATVKAMQQGKALLKAGYAPSLVRAVEVDSSTVDLISDPPDPSLIPRMMFIKIVPKSLADSPNGSTMIGTGPYRFVSWERGTRIVLERFDGYWGQKPSWRQIEFVFRSEPSVRAAMVQAGEAQVALNLTAAVVPGLPKIVTTRAPEVIGFILNSRGQKDGGSPLQDIRVRRALNYAVDREAIIKSIYGGYGALPQGQFNVQGTLGVDPTLKDYAYDPQQARQLVAQAGAVGKTITLYVPSASPWAGVEAMSEAVGKMIEATGLKVDMRIVDWRSTWLPIFQAQHNSTAPLPGDMLAFGHSNEFWESAMRSALYFQSQERGGGYFETRDDALDKMLEDAKRETDLAKRAQLMQAAWRYMNDQALSMPILARVSIHATNADVNWKPRGDELVLVSQITWGPQK